MTTATDFTKFGTKIEGQYENDRNAESAELIKAIVRKAFNVTDVIVAHHIVYVTQETDKQGFKYQVVEEIPSLDTLIFDHEIAKKIWGENDYIEVLQDLALVPCSQRDAMLAQMWKDHHGSDLR